MIATTLLPFLALLPAQDIVLDEVLVVPPVGVSRRAAVHTDAIEEQIVTGRWSAPAVGTGVTKPDGEDVAWERIEREEDGWFRHAALRGGYAFAAVDVAVDAVWMLEARGHGLAYVNGVPRAGDPYDYGFVRLPVDLRAGPNELLFRCGRGRLRARLFAPPGELFLDVADATLPDLVAGADEPMPGAVVATNASLHRQADVSIAVFAGEHEVGRGRAYALLPLGTRKLAFTLDPTALAGLAGEDVALELRLLHGAGSVDRATVTLRRRSEREPAKNTFVSAIDGSVQYYAVRPATAQAASDTAPAAGERAALILSLHGASVEATSQAGAYSSKTWAHVVAPTNRRPFGFDWEDWGRLDTLEVLAHARERYDCDPGRTYLTGHSMGGHGTWQVGAHFPDRFAAIGPSAGWISFWSYADSERPAGDECADLMRRATAASDTASLATNYLQLGVYVLHGDADDNVPVDEARTMAAWLEEHHEDWRYHEQPDAGHWWDDDDEPGADCVDWAPMLDFFARRTLPGRDAVRFVDFATANPAVSADCHWACIGAQQRAGLPARVRLRCDPGRRRFRGTTDNVARLALDVGHLAPAENVHVELDGQTLGTQAGLAWPADGKLWFERSDQAWRATAAPPARDKGPHRYGPFKDALRNRLLFVYGTRGTPEENAWALAKARFDAETLWYRGNFSIDVIPDVAFDSQAEPDRGVLLFGNADTNGAWEALLGDSPVQVRRGAVRLSNGRVWEGEDLACLFLRPRPGSARACVAAIAGSGLPGLRLTERLPYFVSGVAYPDCTILDPAVLREGQDGVLAAGFFGLDWSLAGGEFAFR